MIVCIAEKPSVAKEISTILGANSRRDGYFEGNGYQVTWTFGHLCTLKEPHDYIDRWRSWNLSTLPMIPEKFGIKVMDDGGVQKQFKTIETLVANATEIVNCGDAGQEGELIQRWVLHQCKAKAPLKRLWISSLTEEAIRDGFNNLMDGHDFDSLYTAGMARAVGDWLLGLNATRLYTLKFGSGKNVLSIGRVQTPTLALVVNRQKEIENFEPEPYWELKTVYRETTFSVKSGRFSDKEKAKAKLEEIIGKPFFITNVEIKKGNEHPPKLFDLTSLQVECNKKFGYSADDTLKFIQSLYEKKLTTYPRVDTTFLSNDIYKKVPGILNGMKSYGALIQPLLGNKIRKSKKVFDDKKITDHHAIIPTGVYSENMTVEERRVYDLVSKRFISVFYPDCKVSNTTVEGETNKVEFKATGKQILEPGWRVIYQNEQAKEKSDENIMPAFTKGESGPHIPDLAEKMTQPPKYHTEATLLRAMETAGKNVEDEELRDLMKENGIGRPSTRANIIETLFRRRYIQRERKRIIATQTGVELIDTIQNDLLKSAELTGQWERKLRQIENNDYDIKLFMYEMKKMVWDTVQDVKLAQKKSITIIDPEEEKRKVAEAKKAERAEKKANAKEAICPVCKKGKILKGSKAWGCSEYTNGCRFMVPFEFHGKKLTESQMKRITTHTTTLEIKGFVLNGKKINGQIKLNNDGSLSLEESVPEKLICPRCKQGEMLKGNSAWGCQNYQKGCKTIIPFEFAGKKITENQLKQLIAKGSTNKVKGLLLANGEKVDAKISFDANFQLTITQ